MNPRGRESLRGCCSAAVKYRGRVRTPGPGRGSEGRWSTEGCVVSVCGLGAAATGSVTSGGGGEIGNGGGIGSTVLTIGVEVTTGVVRAGFIESGIIVGLLKIGVDGTTGVVGSAGAAAKIGTGRTGTRGRQDGRPHVIG